MNVAPLPSSVGTILALSVLAWVGPLSAADPAQKASTLSMAEFLALDIPFYSVEKQSLEAAVESLRTAVKKTSGHDAPPVGVIRYRESTRTEANPWKMEAAISLKLEHDSVANILRYVGELAAFKMQVNYWSIGLYELPDLYHPRPVYWFNLKEIVAVYGKPSKAVTEWLLKKLEREKIPVFDLAVNERTGQVFLVTYPDYASAVLRPQRETTGKEKGN